MTHDTLSVRRRAITGGYADRYESRRASRGADRAYSPRWSDSAVDATWSMLQHESSESQCSADQAMLALLLDGVLLEAALDKIAKIGTSRDRETAGLVLQHHAARAQHAESKSGQHGAMHSCMKQLRKRARAPAEHKQLRVAAGPEVSTAAPVPASMQRSSMESALLEQGSRERAL